MGNHWYYKDGTPCHTVIGANGKERDTTLRDARKLNLLPSVTTIMKGVLAAPALESWKMRETLKVAYGMPPIRDEFVDDWVRGVQDRASEAGEARMEFGTLVHDAIERAIAGEHSNEEVLAPDGNTYPLSQFVNPVMEIIADNGWHIEETETVKVGDGYAGTADAVYLAENEYGIIDFKTTKQVEKPFIPPTYPAQIALYHVAEHGGIGDAAAGYNVFIATERDPGAVKVVRYDAERLRKEYAFAMLLVKAWQHINNYTPE